MVRKVKRTRNHGTWTEAEFFGRIRSAFRRMSMYWKPAQEAKKASRKVVKGKRHKFEYQCAECGGWFKTNEVEIDHIVPAGSLKSFDDLNSFAERLFIEDVSGFQVLCKNKKDKSGKVIHKGCHNRKTSKK